MGTNDLNNRKWIKNYGLWLIVILALIILAITVFLGYYNSWAWVGVVEFSYVNSKPQEVLGTKTFWDWLELIVVPLFLGLAAVFINQAIQQREIRIATEQQHEQARIAAEQQHEQALRDYLNVMSNLLLEHGLYNAKKNDDVRFLAMAYTNNILRQLDSVRKGLVVEFLYSTALIRCKLKSDWTVDSSDEKPNPIIAITKTDLRGLNVPSGLWGGARLTGIYFSDVELVEADFSNANLSKSVMQSCWFDKAKFEKANLSGCDLRYSVFIDADLKDANLSGANLERTIIKAKSLENVKSLEGCIMYDGTMFDPNKKLEEQTIEKEIAEYQSR